MNSCFTGRTTAGSGCKCGWRTRPCGYPKFHLAELAAPSQVEKDFEAAVKELKKLPPPGRKKKKP